jgi:hypothetical protein
MNNSRLENSLHKASLTHILISEQSNPFTICAVLDQNPADALFTEKRFQFTSQCRSGKMEEWVVSSVVSGSKEMLIMRRGWIKCAVIMGIITVAFAQDAWDIARTTINGKKIAIEYGRPVLRGRTLASLMKMLPPDRIWRAGSGPLTLLSTESDLLIGGKRVPRGNYSLYMYCPEKGDYELIVNTDIGQPPGTPLDKATSDRSNRSYPHFMDYTSSIKDQEVARIPLKRISTPRSEVLFYSFETAGKGATLTISWGDQSWMVEFQSAE